MGKGYIRGITTGAIIGAAVSMLFAPQLGRDTRKRIKKFDDMVMDMAEGMYYGIKKMSK
ncbi:YtxH domain-containing protein [Clostridium thermarum]|uniref:YtxH domain-containing protein n=1 Tax=Clostridium thermarum TaxID=1716543 RepID=UPI00111DB062|nr:YtxH domain-containing protein [Clostridium thermarum]